MKLIFAQDDVELVSNVNNWLTKRLSNSKQTNSKQKIIQLPAGNTPLSLYKNWETQHPSCLYNVIFQQVDDVLTGPKAGCFKSFFEQYLPSYIKQFSSLADSPITPDIAILGVGVNGHLAFHEPEINFNFNYGCVKLSPTTCENLNLSDPTWGISYGAGHFMHCNSVLIIAKGKNKKAIVEKAMHEKNPTSPFSYIIKAHPDCTLVTDQECQDSPGLIKK